MMPRHVPAAGGRTGHLRVAHISASLASTLASDVALRAAALPSILATVAATLASTSATISAVDLSGAVEPSAATRMGLASPIVNASATASRTTSSSAPNFLSLVRIISDSLPLSVVT